ncbi:MAG: hemerythrin domain-containing protein [Alphaproteobacteria bacterium]|nr:MAG: hemerythrin domain-containing protein [Alphaproteobacteria bacterium]
MSLLDKFVSVVMPAASAEDRAKARQKAEAHVPGNEWLGMALSHHRQIESLFAQAKTANDAGSRRKALRELGALLLGHANAEEAVIYPTIADRSGKIHAVMAYEEQAMTKIQMAKLELIDPMTQDWVDKLEHIEGAVQQHVYQEENEWFPDVAEHATAEEKAQLNARFAEEFDRYQSDLDGIPSAKHIRV